MRRGVVLDARYLRLPGTMASSLRIIAGVDWSLRQSEAKVRIVPYKEAVSSAERHAAMTWASAETLGIIDMSVEELVKQLARHIKDKS